MAMPPAAKAKPVVSGSLRGPGFGLIHPSRQQTESSELLEGKMLVLDIPGLVHARVANGGIQPFGKSSSTSMKVSVSIASVVARKAKAALPELRKAPQI
jgi:hypothetical protein